MFPQPGGPSGPIGTPTAGGVPIAGYAGPEAASTVDTLPDAEEQQADVAESKFTRPFNFAPSGLKGSVAPDLKNRKFRVLVLILVVVVAAVGLVTIWPKASSQSEQVSLQWRPGQLARYRVSMAMTGHVTSPALKEPAAASAHLDAVVNMRVGSVASDGTATMEVSTSAFQVSTSPPTASDKIPETIRTHMQIGADGRMALGDFGLSQLGLSSEISPGLVQFAPVLPAGKVAAGASWTETTDLQLSSGETLHATEKNTLLGFTNVDGLTVAVVSSKISVPINLTYPVSDFAQFASKSPKVQAEVAASDGTMKITGSTELSMTSQIAVDTGQLVATHNSGTVTLAMAPEAGTKPPVPSMNFTGSASMTVEQVKIKAKPVGGPSA